MTTNSKKHKPPETIKECNEMLLRSEKQYKNELNAIRIHIAIGLENYAKQCHIPNGSESVKKVFKYINLMSQFHSTFYDTLDENNILSNFSKYIGFLSIYQDYLLNYSSILDIFSSWTSIEFREFMTIRLQSLKQYLDDRISSLPWYLYRPFDRIREYHRYFKDLLKLTDPTDDDYKLIHKLIMNIKPLYNEIKSSAYKMQQQTRLAEVQLEIHGHPFNLLKDDRIFIMKKCCRMKRAMMGKKYKKIYLYLFNDLFLWVSARTRYKGSYSFCSNNLDIEIPKDGNDEDDFEFSIGLKTEKNKRLLVFNDDKERNKVINFLWKLYTNNEILISGYIRNFEIQYMHHLNLIIPRQIYIFVMELSGVYDLNVAKERYKNRD